MRFTFSHDFVSNTDQLKDDTSKTLPFLGNAIARLHQYSIGVFEQQNNTLCWVLRADNINSIRSVRGQLENRSNIEFPEQQINILTLTVKL